MNQEHDYQALQRRDEEKRFFSVLTALQKVYRAGLRDEAYLLAYEAGLFTEFKKEINDGKSG